MTDAGIQWFPSLGFRPAIWTPPHRADAVDPDRLIVAPDADVPLIGKFDPYAPATGYAWGTWIPSYAPRATEADLAGPIPHPAASWHPATPTQPWWPSEPSFPCCIIDRPFEPLPPVAPVPVPASGVLLACAVAALFIIRRKP